MTENDPQGILCAATCCCRGSSFGIGKRGLLEKGPFQENPLSRDSREFREIRESPQTVKTKGESDHFLENLKILEMQEIRAVKRPLW